MIKNIDTKTMKIECWKVTFDCVVLCLKLKRPLHQRHLLLKTITNGGGLLMLSTSMKTICMFWNWNRLLDLKDWNFGWFLSWVISKKKSNKCLSKVELKPSLNYRCNPTYFFTDALPNSCGNEFQKVLKLIIQNYKKFGLSAWHYGSGIYQRHTLH